MAFEQINAFKKRSGKSHFEVHKQNLNRIGFDYEGAFYLKTQGELDSRTPNATTRAYSAILARGMVSRLCL